MRARSCTPLILRHYALYTDPGDVRVKADSNRSVEVRVTAYAAPDQSRVTLVLLNVSDAAQVVNIDPGAFVASRVEGYRTLYRPGESEAWQA